MVTLKINSASIITFDGNVLEVFPGSRVHIGLLREIGLVTDRHGKHTLQIIGELFSSKDITVDEDAFPKVTQLIATVQKAKAEFKFD